MYLRILVLVGNNKTGNVCINIALIRVRVTDVDVEKQCVTYSECVCSLIIKPTRCTNFSTFFGNRPLHVSDSFCVHHQESSTLHTAIGVCHAADCLL